MTLVEVLKIVVLSIMKGFTKWLPTSSTGHMVPVDEVIWLNQPDALKNVFLVVIQLGAILVVVVMYLHKLNPFSPIKSSRQKDATWALWIEIVIACVPAAMLGLLLDNRIEAHLFNTYMVTAVLIIYDVLFIVLENSSVCSDPQINKVRQISTKTVFMIGMIQLLALIPGTSRSGSTILGAMVLGYPRGAAAEFLFFLGILVVFRASLLELVEYFVAGNVFAGPQIFHTVLGMLIAFMVSVYSIQFLMSYVRRHDFKFFGYYWIILGVIVLTYFGTAALAS